LIPESFIQDLLARVDVVDVVGRYVQLRKGGANLLGLCPFHNEKSPSFTVSPTKQFYHCFGCGAHGTAITFLIEHTGASFPEAVRSLAASVGMTVPEEPRSPRQRQQDQQRKQEVSRHEAALESARRFYLSALKLSPRAIDYLKGRGLSGEIAARFGLGWSGEDRRGLAKVFPNYDDPLLVECGLVIEADDGRRYDRFRERIMFPIRNGRGKLIGFGGRIIGKGEPKYLNSPETPLFSKGRELYGLWEARAGVRREGCVLVVEGYMDVVGLAQHGLDNAVATLGTSTTPDHVQKLLRLSDKVIFSYDGDAAGRRAAWRALQACLPLMRDDVSVRFLFLPTEHDPDSYIREFGDKAFRAYMDEAVSLSRFMLEELSSHHRLDEAEGRAACVHEALPLLASLPEGAYRLQVEREFAQRVLLTSEELTYLLEKAQQARRPGAAGADSSGVAGPGGLIRQPTRDGIVDWKGMPAVAAEAKGDKGSQAVARHEEPGPGQEPSHYPEDPEHGWIPPDPAFPAGDSNDDHFEAPHWEPPWEASGDVPMRRSAPSAYSGDSSRQSFGSKWDKGRKRRTGSGGAAGTHHQVTPLAKHLLRLLIMHPALEEGLGDQQLEILERGPHLGLVRDLIELIAASGARHIGALLQAAEPGSDLEQVLSGLGPQVLAEEELPDPQSEWNDALRRIELDLIKAEQTALAQAGLRTVAEQQRYQELNRRRILLEASGSRKLL
jgi:DNA primase, catalytic core